MENQMLGKQLENKYQDKYYKLLQIDPKLTRQNTINILPGTTYAKFLLPVLVPKIQYPSTIVPQHYSNYTTKTLQNDSPIILHPNTTPKLLPRLIQKYNQVLQFSVQWQQQYRTIVLQYYSTIVLQYYSTIVLQYYSTIVLQYYSTIVLQYYSTIVLQYYSTSSTSSSTIVLQYYQVLQYYSTIVLQYYSTSFTIGCPSCFYSVLQVFYSCLQVFYSFLQFSIGTIMLSIGLLQFSIGFLQFQYQHHQTISIKRFQTSTLTTKLKYIKSEINQIK